MNPQEVMALLYMEKRLFPREKGLDVPPEELSNIAETQAEMLRDIPFELGKAAVAAHAASSPYAPAISEIRAYARKMTEPEPLDTHPPSEGGHACQRLPPLVRGGVTK